MYLLTLPDGKDIHLKKRRVIPKEELEIILTAEDLLKRAKTALAKQKKEVKERAERTYQEAYEQGFQEGLEQFNSHIVYCDQRIKELRHHVQQQILPLILKATKKLVGEQLRLHPETIVDIVIQAIKSVAQCKVVKIVVNREELERLEEQKALIKSKFEKLDSLEIVERGDIPVGSCSIETEKGILTSNLDSQLHALEKALKAHLPGET